MKVNKSDISVVQHLYLLQIDLYKFLKSDLTDPEERREARKQMKEFAILLKQADWRYMGGEDVLDNLQKIQEEISAKISSTPRAKKALQAKVSKPKKIVKKKAPAKKVAKKKAVSKKKETKKKK